VHLKWRKPPWLHRPLLSCVQTCSKTLREIGLCSHFKSTTLRDYLRLHGFMHIIPSCQGVRDFIGHKLLRLAHFCAIRSFRYEHPSCPIMHKT
jgi:hypothetical protein